MELFSGKKYEEVPLTELVEQDLQNSRINLNEEGSDKFVRSVKAVIKAIIGSDHEYTFEEALFILQHEDKLDKQTFEQLKVILLRLNFFLYSNTPDSFIEELKDTHQAFLRLLPKLLEQTDKDQFLALYGKAKKKIQTVDDQARMHKLLHSHKKSLIKEQAKLVADLQKSTSKTLQKVSESTKDVPEQPPKTEVHFDEDFFQAITGCTRDLFKEFEAEGNALFIIDLYIKFYLVSGMSLQDIRQDLLPKMKAESELDKALEYNASYLEDLQEYQDMNFTIIICLYFLIGRMQKVDTNTLIENLKSRNFKDIDVTLALDILSFD